MKVERDMRVSLKMGRKMERVVLLMKKAKRLKVTGSKM